MVFLVISKFNAEFVKKFKVAMQGTMSNIIFLSYPGQVTPRQSYLTVYAYQ